uniref:Uncharacterized protein n=1 Tax=Rhizophora mucronata TaxID=61149 RepID=A0A2P2J2D4_RHIMU
MTTTYGRRSFLRIIVPSRYHPDYPKQCKNYSNTLLLNFYEPTNSVPHHTEHISTRLS